MTHDQSRSRYRNQTVNKSYSIELTEKLKASDKKQDPMRGSSRFSKGYQEELDKVAARINKSIILNQESACGESLEV